MVAAGVDEITAGEFQISHTLLKSSGILRARGRVQFNFKRYLLRPEVDEKIDLIPLRGAPEIGLATRHCLLEGRNQLVDDKGFPAHSPGGMGVECRDGMDPEKKMQKAGVPKVYLGDLHESFTDVCEIGWQLSNQESLFQDIDISIHGVVTNPQRGR